VRIRPSTEADLPAIRAIYADSVLTATGTFELTPPDLAEMARRRAAVIALGLPHLAAEDEGRLLGFAYAGPFRPRPAYRFTVEDSVYVAAEARGRGVGKALLQALIARCEALGMRRMLAVIGDSANTGSIALHRGCGFTGESIAPGVGWKFNRWLDVVTMHRALGPGAAEPPQDAGLAL
jgi:phosphinothricin acetyltransferase